MTGTAPAPPPRPRPARRGPVAPGDQVIGRLVIDRETLEHLPSPIHRMVAERRIKDGTWKLAEDSQQRSEVG